MNATTRSDGPAHRRTSVPPPKFVFERSFVGRLAEERFGDMPVLDHKLISQTYMPDEVTRDLAKRMHYAGWRVSTARRRVDALRWRQRYFEIRDQIILGNRKLVYRAVRQRMAMSHCVEDVVGDCHIVLIHAVAAYNPWLGIRFSTYAFTCLVRALSRLSQRIAKDWLSRVIPLDAVPDTDPVTGREPSAAVMPRVEDYLQKDHPLLSPREKAIIGRRFNLTPTTGGHTLEKVGRELGLSKERVRQVQASALGKLRLALTIDA